MRHYLIAVTIIALNLNTQAIAGEPPLPIPQQIVDLQRYAGDWFVHGCIPLKIPLFSDADARNYTEHYELLGPDAIRMTSAFDTGQQGEFKRKTFSFKGDVVDTLNATWKIWFLWPIGANYSIVYLDESYTTTIVASNNRRYAWIMSRQPHISDAQYDELVGFLAATGFDPNKFRRVPHDTQQVAHLN